MTTLESLLNTRAEWDFKTAAGLKVIRSYRNAEKRSYGIMYLAHLVSPGRPEPDTKMFDLTYMGAQAVRLSLSSALNKTEA